MVTEQTLASARDTAAELRRHGETERAEAIEALIEAASGDVTPAPDQAGPEIADLLGVDGPTLRTWVQEGRFAGYRAGNLMIPREVVEEYVRRARTSLDLEVISDEEAARLVAEGRRRE
jgi:excisionase family DNA binding protein